jgi:tRNA pseudouridine32 synthase/23S rRNA pseudouridine746 synthase
MMFLFLFWILCPYVLQGFVLRVRKRKEDVFVFPFKQKTTNMILYSTTQKNCYKDNNDMNDKDDDYSLLCPSSYPSKTFGAQNLEITFKQIDTDTGIDKGDGHDNNDRDNNNNVQMLPLQKYHARKHSRRRSTTARAYIKDLVSNSDSGSSNNNAESSTSLIFDVCSDIPSLDFIYENISRFKHLTKSSISLLEEYYDNNYNNNTTTTTTTTKVDDDDDDNDDTKTTTPKQEQQKIIQANYRRRIRSKIRAECRASLSLIPKRTLRILYCDSHICVVNKPSGVLSVPGHRRNPSLANLVYDTIQPSSTTTITGPDHDSNNDITSSIDNIDQSVVHRLDMATSGIIVYALTKEALSKLHITFRDRIVKKTYHALVEGHLLSPPQPDEDEKGSRHHNPLSSTYSGGRLEGEIDVDMERDPNNPPYMRIAQPRTKNNSTNDSDDDEGDQDDQQKPQEALKGSKKEATRVNHKFLREAPKPSKTTWSILGYEYRDGKPVTRLELRPHTGRTHQLRVHTSQVLGTPIVGDDIYGSGGKNGSYTLCLHAQKLCIHHPISGAAMIFEADAPF